MHVPRLHENVHLRGHAGVYLVLWVDPEENWADLLRLDGDAIYPLCAKVPFIELEPLANERG